MKRTPEESEPPSPWLFLIHHLPPKPAYLRVKVWRRLQGLGAVALKNSVYALPRAEDAQEDFEWVAREIVKEGGEAVVCAAQLLDGLTDAEVENLFRNAREPDYRELAKEARGLLTAASRRTLSSARRKELRAEAAKLRKRLAEVVEIDFFTAPGREASEGLLGELDSRLTEPAGVVPPSQEATVAHVVRAGIWVTRRGIHVDRMASVLGLGFTERNMIPVSGSS